MCKYLKKKLYWRIFTSVRVNLNGISALKMFYLSEEYTPLCECWKQVYGRISTSVRVDKNGVFYTCKCYLNKEYSPLCKFFFLIIFHWRICFCKLTTMVFPTLEYVFYQKNIHLCASWLKLLAGACYLLLDTCYMLPVTCLLLLIIWYLLVLAI